MRDHSLLMKRDFLQHLPRLMVAKCSRRFVSTLKGRPPGQQALILILPFLLRPTPVAKKFDLSKSDEGGFPGRPPGTNKFHAGQFLDVYMEREV